MKSHMTQSCLDVLASEGIVEGCWLTEGCWLGLEHGISTVTSVNA
jgi:hypothetical protein